MYEWLNPCVATVKSYKFRNDCQIKFRSEFHQQNWHLELINCMMTCLIVSAICFKTIVTLIVFIWSKRINKPFPVSLFLGKFVYHLELKNNANGDMSEKLVCHLIFLLGPFVSYKCYSINILHNKKCCIGSVRINNDYKNSAVAQIIYGNEDLRI